ncbi:MAG: hypothetical protein GY906_07975 [bacterium]|nr:hypothetical protein [bacterium]
MRHSHNRLVTVSAPVVVALLLIIAPAVICGAQVKEASFLIEEIRFEGLHLVSERIVLAESLLKAGSTYSETELQHAVRRIRRLPSVLTVDFRLDRGTERGRYRLIVSVEETRRFFFGFGLGGSEVNYFHDEDPNVPSVPGFDDEVCIAHDCYSADDFSFASVGIRQPIGSTGVLWGAAQARSSIDDLTAFELGYTQYDLLGSGAFASGRVAISNDGDQWWYTLEAGIPIGGNHSLRLLIDGFERDRPWYYGSVDSQEIWSELSDHRLDLGLEWRIDSRDDPLFPTAGRLLSAGLRFRDRESEAPKNSELGTSLPIEKDTLGSETLFANLSGAWFRPLNRRSSLSWGGEVRFGKSDAQGRFWNGSRWTWDDPIDYVADTALAGFYIGYLRTVWRPTASRNLSDLRWETTLGGRYGQARFDTGLPSTYWDEASLTTSLVLRNRWGVFRFSLQGRVSDGGLR